MQAGVPSNNCQAQDRAPGSPVQNPCPQLEHFGGVWRFIASGRNQDHMSDGIRHSTGHRNVVALEWNPLANRLFLVMHGRDQLDTLWPAELHRAAAQRAARGGIPRGRSRRRSRLALHVLRPGAQRAHGLARIRRRRQDAGGARPIQGAVDRLPRSLGAERSDLLHRHAVSREVSRRRVHRVSRLVESRDRKTVTASCSCR